MSETRPGRNGKRRPTQADWLLWRETLQVLNLTIAQAQGRERTDKIAWRRHLAFYFMRRLTKGELSYPTIAHLFKHDHSTAMYAERIVMSRAKREPSFAKRLDEYEAIILAHPPLLADFVEGPYVGCAA